MSKVINISSLYNDSSKKQSNKTPKNKRNSDMIKKKLLDKIKEKIKTPSELNVYCDVPTNNLNEFAETTSFFNTLLEKKKKKEIRQVKKNLLMEI